MCEGITEVDSGGSVCLRLLNWDLNETRLKKKKPLVSLFLRRTSMVWDSI